MILAPSRKIWTPWTRPTVLRPVDRRPWYRRLLDKYAVSGEHVIRADDGRRVVKADGTFVVSDGTEDCGPIYEQAFNCNGNALIDIWRGADAGPQIQYYRDQGYCLYFSDDSPTSATPGTSLSEDADALGACEDCSVCCSDFRPTPPSVLANFSGVEIPGDQTCCVGTRTTIECSLGAFTLPMIGCSTSVATYRLTIPGAVTWTRYNGDHATPCLGSLHSTGTLDLFINFAVSIGVSGGEYHILAHAVGEVSGATFHFFDRTGIPTMDLCNGSEGTTANLYTSCGFLVGSGWKAGYDGSVTITPIY